MPKVQISKELIVTEFIAFHTLFIKYTCIDHSTKN